MLILMSARFREGEGGGREGQRGHTVIRLKENENMGKD